MSKPGESERESRRRSAALHLRCLDTAIEIRCEDASIRELLRMNFGAMSSKESEPDLVYGIDVESPRSIRVARQGSSFDARANDTGELIYRLESDLVVELQLRRPDLLFLHAAVLELDEQAYVLAGRSGAGKSTTCWGLLHHGFRYVSDEMAPIAPSPLGVLGYPHALCMKRDPPSGFPLPDRSWRTSRGIHVSLSGSAVCAVDGPLRIGGLVLVEYDPSAEKPSLRSLNPGEAAARLYPNILNALAHQEDGLPAVAEIVAKVPAFKLQSAGLDATCGAVRDCIDRLNPGGLARSVGMDTWRR